MKKSLIILIVIIIIGAGVAFWWYRKNYSEISAIGSDASGKFITVISKGTSSNLRVGGGVVMGLPSGKSIYFDSNNNLIVKDKSGSILSSTPYSNLKLGKI
jgi:hypothetical protein